MNIKLKQSHCFLTATIMVLFNSCNKEEETLAKPVINLIELGLGNSHVAYIGADLHIEAEIVARRKN